jgi:hypothetical protein
MEQVKNKFRFFELVLFFKRLHRAFGSDAHVPRPEMSAARSAAEFGEVILMPTKGTEAEPQISWIIPRVSAGDGTQSLKRPSLRQSTFARQLPSPGFDGR